MTQPNTIKEAERHLINALIKQKAEFLIERGFWKYCTEFRKAQMAWNNGNYLAAWVLFEDENYHDIAERIRNFSNQYRF